MPKRSVTRFFIPLIDVLTLLFCIFLLMPLVKATPDKSEDKSPGSAAGGSAQDPAKAAEEARKQLKELEQVLEARKKELEQVREARKTVLQEHVVVRVLEIDAATGKLYYYGPERTEVTEAKAHELIRNDRRAIGESKHELYYAILYPRDPGSPHPFVDEKQKYNEWFEDVAHGWDRPGETFTEVKP
jgi:hypothetical protein